MAGSPTNTTIMVAITKLEGKIDSLDTKTDAIAAQAAKTNGRVTKTEEFINAIKAVDAYKRDQPPTITANTVNYSQKWFLTEGGKQILWALAGVITIVGGVIAIRGGL